MTARTVLTIVALGLCAAALPAPGTALEVYQWTDENGVVHFSQWAPDDDVENFETVSVEGGGPKDHGIGISEADDPEGYKAHREEMDVLWAEIEARRERPARAPATEVVYLRPEPDYGYPYLFPGRGIRPPFKPVKPPHRPRPGDGEEPDTRPVESVPFKRP